MHKVEGVFARLTACFSLESSEQISIKFGIGVLN